MLDSKGIMLELDLILNNVSYRSIKRADKMETNNLRIPLLHLMYW